MWLAIGILGVVAITLRTCFSLPLILVRRFIYQMLWWTANLVTCTVIVATLAIALHSIVCRWRGKTHMKGSGRITLKFRFVFSLLVLWLSFEAWGLVMLWQQTFSQPTEAEPVTLPHDLPRSPADVLYLVAIGGSTTKGAPFSDVEGNRFSFPHLTGLELQRRHPGLTAAVQNFGQDGATLSNMVAPLQSLTFRPDVLLVYSGHNEFLRLAPESSFFFGWENEPILDFDRIEQRFPPLSFLARAMAQELLSTDFAVAPRQSERQLFDVPLCGPQQMDQVYAQYQSTMAAIIKWCRTEGILPIVVVPASNASGIGPNRSVLPRDIWMSERERLEQLWEQINQLPLASPHRLALLEQARVVAPTFAETWYQLGREYDAIGRTDDANVAFQHAIDYDGNPMRAPSRIADICRNLPAAVIDARGLWRPLSSRGVLGDRQFHDYCHPTLSAYVVLSNTIVATIEAEGLPSGREPNEVPPFTVADVAERYNIDRAAWQRVFEASAIEWQRLSMYRFDPLPSQARAAACAEAVRRIESETYPKEDGIPRSDAITALGTPRR